MCRSGPGIHSSIQIQRIAGMCKPGKYDSQRRFTTVAIRCDTSEETRINQIKKHPMIAKLFKNLKISTYYILLVTFKVGIGE
ncbi:hypothetical protein EKS35_03965 [Enterobacter hormaechei subsp. steigerwaltii]|nr:hypothetical protein EKS35_03965 [Enterobacter hormaechei subsp. steigerwaltii]